jgi:thioredoxin-related protein
MKRLVSLGMFLLLLTAICLGSETEKDVPWRAQAEIARRGKMVERVDGYQDAGDPVDAISAALQPPADDSHKWYFTLVTTQNCRYCDMLRRDFEQDPKLQGWVNTKDYTKSWAHFQVVQIEDQSQTWRFKDFRPTSFPTLIVQPPLNNSWGDPHTIVYVRQGYLKPADLDSAIRGAIQQYATKTFPRHMAWSAKEGGASDSGFQQGGEVKEAGGWTPPVTPPMPLPQVPNYPAYPNLPQEYPPPQPQQPQPSVGGLLSQLLAGFLGGQVTGNFLLIGILGWQLYRGFAKTKGIPLVVDDATAAQLIQLLKSLQQAPQQTQAPSRPVSLG